MHSRILIIALIFSTSFLIGQSVGINNTGSLPDNSAMLDIQSNNKGVLIPRMDSGQRTGIIPAAEGLLVFDTDTKSFWFKTATGWIELVSGNIDELSDADGETKIKVEETPNDNNIRFNVGNAEAMILKENGDLKLLSGNLGIGTNDPSTPFQVKIPNLPGLDTLAKFSVNSNQDVNTLSILNGSGGAGSFLPVIAGRNEEGVLPALFFIGSSGSDDVANNTSIMTFDARGIGQAINNRPLFLWSNANNPKMLLDAKGQLGIGTTSPSALLHINQGPVLYEGTIDDGFTGPLATSGAGTRLMWIPEKAAFRVGQVDGTHWDINYIGKWSTVAGGSNNIANGENSFVGAGIDNTAGGTGSFIGGGYKNLTLGNYSSVVGGLFNEANGYGSFVGGGDNNEANGFRSFVGGGGTNYASGSHSFVGGNSNDAHSYGETVFGLYSTNYSPNSTTTFHSEDRLFVVGNGINTGSRSNALTILKNGNIGIGFDNPTTAKLVVNGTGISGTLSAAYQYGLNGPLPVFNFTSSYSARFTHDVLAAGYLAASDARIKIIEGISNTKEDLNTLQKIEITNYTMKDSLSKGNIIYKKVIAQQVKKVFPQAVSSDMTSVIPDIYQIANCNDGWVQLKTDLKIGDRVQLITKGNTKIYEVRDITKDGFYIEDLNLLKDKVFVFGREVNDFHSVDYEALSMLNISATQAQQEIIETQAEEITDLKSKLDQLMNRMVKMEAAFNQNLVKME